MRLLAEVLVELREDGDQPSVDVALEAGTPALEHVIDLGQGIRR